MLRETINSIQYVTLGHHMCCEGMIFLLNSVWYTEQFWWQRNDQEIMASLFARFKAMQFLLVGHVKG